MKKIYRAACICLLFTTTAAGFSSMANAKESFTSKQKAGYSLGVNISNNIQAVKNSIDREALFNGLRDGLQAKELQMSEQEMQQTLIALQEKVAKEQQAIQQKIGKKNIEKGKKFLAENKKKKGVTTLKSGLQYKVIKSGKGKSPKLTDTVTTHYRGTLLDGTEFDSSYSRNEPTSFPVNRVISGWTEALQLMKPGDKWKLFIPAELAYGKPGFGRKIGPQETLIFEIELIKIGS